MVEDLKAEFENELLSILNYWRDHTVDKEYGGFFGKIDNENKVDKTAPKGAVLNARILWSFSAAYNQQKNEGDLQIALRSYDYLKTYFVDNEFGGVYWSVDEHGNPLDTKKQIYAIAFAIYGLAEFYEAADCKEALDLAISLYRDIEVHSFDVGKNGYLEALSRDWRDVGDLRLSEKDANEKKTMNTHLHILEAYTNLYRYWPDGQLAERIANLLQVFEKKILNAETKHLVLFFNENWQSKHHIVSYGHDIEASWLMLEAAEILHHEELISKFKKLAVEIAVASIEGIDESGGMIYELDVDKGHKVAEKHWWVQAEAMVGFLNAYQLSGDKAFYNYFIGVWNFTKNHIIDKENGEWFWGVNADGSLMQGEDKAGFWKCPYHNSRACMEIINRLKTIYL
ncbi:mannobiose 2-epimerase [Pedobacter sp. UYP30]|uniref:AGE family epimerase/isomerase n=1 Tax=Pedobacter sp. UYP30 TaxID=1756400 RepID=UPI0033950248